MQKVITELLTKMVMEVIGSIIHNWIPLFLTILIAAIMRVYIDAEKLKKTLLGRPNVSIWASVTVGAFTPLCACGTMSVAVGLLTTTLPWGPIMAFLTSSPLMSPEGFVMMAGILSLNFAIALTAASILIGLISGYITHFIEKKSHFLKNQTRFATNSSVQTYSCSAEPGSVTAQVPSCCGTLAPASPQTCDCGEPAPPPVQTCGCGDPGPVSAIKQTCCSNLQAAPKKKTVLGFMKRIKWRELGEVMVNVGLKQILLFYSIFIAIGYLITYFVPTSFIITLLGAKNITSVPLAGLIGLPLYVTTEASIPLIKALMGHGAGGGSMLAFMITGQATSAWVVAGISTFMKKRVISLYIAFVLLGGILCGYLFDIVLTLIK
ncbi:MAG: permease [Firmicutes bacterium]|nr:permease [Bacillota bacterium]